jgi:long-chain acyl-CoA synthetase
MSLQATRLFDFPYIQLEKFNLPKAYNTKYNGQWVSTSSKEFIEKINTISRALLRMGVKPNDKIAVISSSNRTEWNVMDHGVLQLGAQNVPMYPTITAEEYAYIFEHSESIYCFVSDVVVYEKAKIAKEKCPKLKEIYSFDEIPGCKNWKELLELGADTGNQDEVEKLKDAVKPETLATIIYTSGTTGVPKGVMLSHNNVVTNVNDSMPRMPLELGKTVSFSFLPVCHSFERMVQYLYVNAGCSIYFAESMEKISENIKEVKPDIMTAVPRLLEKVYDSIINKGNALTGIKKALFFWAVGLGLHYKPYGENGWWYEKKLALARKLIFSKWREGLGGNLSTIVSGSAALQARLAKVFTAAGMTVMEGYGLTETSPVITVNMMDKGQLRIGTVGLPIRNIEVKIAEDGEILCKGPNVMQGYYKDPEKTAEVMTGDWFHTGDKGEFDADGFLKITGRKKEIFKTSGGKYVSPALLENEMKKSHFIEQIIVVGEGEKMPAALIQPDFAFFKAWAARKEFELPETNEGIIAHPRVIKRIQKDMDKYNERFAKWEQVKKFELTPDLWTIDNGLLTPTMKIKRDKIIAKYKDLYQKMYEGSTSEE